MITRAFSKHLRKNPVGDDEILAALDWIDNMTHVVRHGGEILPTPDVFPEIGETLTLNVEDLVQVDA